MLRCSVTLRGRRSASRKYYSTLQNKISVIQSKVLVRTTTYVSVVQSITPQRTKNYFRTTNEVLWCGCGFLRRWSCTHCSERGNYLVTYERMRCDFLVQKHWLDLHFDWRCHKDILWREAKM